MANQLHGKRVAVVATDGFEQSELTDPVAALKNAGATVEIVSPKAHHIQGMRHHDKGDTVAVDRTIDEVRSGDYDALVLPGGVANPDALRTNPLVVHFVRRFFEETKPVAAICHAPWTLIEADVVKGRQLTSWPSVKTDLRNAGADWVDRDVVIDEGLVTSRKPDDLPVFCRTIVQVFAEPRRKAA